MKDFPAHTEACDKAARFGRTTFWRSMFHLYLEQRPVTLLPEKTKRGDEFFLNKRCRLWRKLIPCRFYGDVHRMFRLCLYHTICALLIRKDGVSLVFLNSYFQLFVNAQHLSARPVTGKDAHLTERHMKPHGDNSAHAIICAVSLGRLTHRDKESVASFLDLLASRPGSDEHPYVHGRF